MNASTLNSHSLREFRRGLLAWYDACHRELPWRKTKDPYRIWISEIMLQQTRVAAVIPHYQKFLQRFPSVEKLARARESSVLAMWSGLGYYRRARSLHAAAKIIVTRYGSIFPETSTDLSALPGIGKYTSAAIASIAFGEPVAAVDCNVRRVLQRIFGRTLGTADLYSAANQFLSNRNPGDFNQAMMELGATVCLPQQPECSICPVSKCCVAFAADARRGGSSQAIKRCLDTRTRAAMSSRQAPRKKKTIRYALSSENDSVLLVKRSTGASLMPGMWELPENRSKELPWMRFRHSITTTDYEVFVTRASPSSRNGKWVKNDRAGSLPLTGLARKILTAANIIQAAL